MCAMDKVKKHWIHLRLSEDEFNIVTQNFKATTCRTRSEYIRKIILNKPVNVKVRNQSADEFLAVALLLKKELNAVGNNFNQAVHKLHILSENKDLVQWLISHDAMHKTLLKKVNEISAVMEKIYQQWLLK